MGSGGVPGTRWKYRRERSRALSGALLLVVVVRLVVDGAEERKNVLLFAALDVFIQGGGDGIFFSAVAAQLLGLFAQAVVNGEVGSHGWLPKRSYTSLGGDPRRCDDCRSRRY